MSETVRAFIAVRPGPEVLDRLNRLEGELRATEWGKAFRWVQPGNLHLTLLFLGDVETAALREIERELALIAGATEPFELECAGIGCFPNVRRPSVLWAGIDGDSDRLHSLQAAVVKGCARFGSHRERKPFRAHLTLARARAFDRRLAAGLEADVARLGGGSFGAWTCASVSLVASRLQSGGSEYRDLATLPFTRSKSL